MVWIQIDSRKVFISPATQHPNGAWVNQQARNFCHHLEDEKLKATHVTHDADTKFTCLFDEFLRTEKIESNQLPVKSPNLNAYVERFIQTLQKECLDRFLRNACIRGRGIGRSRGGGKCRPSADHWD